MSPDTGLRAGRDHLYLARIDTAGFRAHAGPEAREEGIGECRALPLREFEHMLVTGRISDAYTLAAYGLARARGLLGEGGPRGPGPAPSAPGRIMRGSAERYEEADPDV